MSHQRRPPGARRPVDPHRQDAGGHGGRPAVVGRVAAASRRTGPAHRARRVVVEAPGTAWDRRFRLRGMAQCLRRCCRRAAHGQFGRAAHRLRRASHGRGDHRRGARAGARCGGPSCGFREPRPRGRSPAGWALSTIVASLSPSPGARVRPSASSGRSPVKRAPRCASTAPVARG